MTTNIYVDGSGLHHDVLAGTPYRWLDLGALCRRLLPDHEVGRIHYFTALVSGLRSAGPGSADRQDAYLRALETLPEVSVHYGRFASYDTRMPTAEPAGGRRTAVVVRTVEKGSMVKLATRLVSDAYDGDAVCFVLISNARELAEPVRMVKRRLGRCVGVLNGCPPEEEVQALYGCRPDFIRRITADALAASQFPSRMSDERGSFERPAEW